MDLWNSSLLNNSLWDRVDTMMDESPFWQRVEKAWGLDKLDEKEEPSFTEQLLGAAVDSMGSRQKSFKQEVTDIRAREAQEARQRELEARQREKESRELEKQREREAKEREKQMQILQKEQARQQAAWDSAWSMFGSDFSAQDMFHDMSIGAFNFEPMPMRDKYDPWSLG